MLETRAIVKTIMVRASSDRLLRALIDPAERDAWLSIVPPAGITAVWQHGPLYPGSSRIAHAANPASPVASFDLVLNLHESGNGHMVPTSVHCTIAPASVPLGHGASPARTLLTMRHDGIPVSGAWAEASGAIEEAWVTNLVFLRFWVERGTSRHDLENPLLFATICKRQDVPLPRSAVIRAFLDKQVLDTWLGARVDVDPRPGGHMDVRWPSNEQVWGEIALLDPPTHAVWQWWDADHFDVDGERGTATVMIWSLSGSDTMTTISLVDRGYDLANVSADFLTDINEGWESMMASIPRALKISMVSA